MSWFCGTLVVKHLELRVWRLSAKCGYMFGPAAIVKLILDRLLMFTAYFMEGARSTKPGATIALSGRRDLRGVTQPFLNALAAGLGFRLVDSLYFHRPGPGEVLLDDDLIRQAHELGRRVATPHPRGTGDRIPVMRLLSGWRPMPLRSVFGAKPDHSTPPSMWRGVSKIDTLSRIGWFLTCSVPQSMIWANTYLRRR